MPTLIGYFIYRLYQLRHLGAILLFAPLALKSYAQQPTEYQVKAVFIYNFVNFVEWPTSAFQLKSDPFIIAVAGQNVFGNTLSQAVGGETYNGHPIQIRMVNSPAEIDQCHILFIARGSTDIPKLLAHTQGKPILTISDTDDFLTSGGMIRFFLEDNKVKIEINQQEAANNQLQVSSKVLRVAKIYNSR